MTALDLHPEELLDRKVQGTLTADEALHLDAHLAQCDVCRFELEARQDFAAVPVGGASVDDLVTRALAGLPEAAPARKASGWSVRRLRTPLAVAAALGAMMSFAAVTPVFQPVVRAIVALVMPAPVEAPAPKALPRFVPKPEPVREVVPAPEVPAPAVEEAVTPEPAAPIAVEPAPRVEHAVHPVTAREPKAVRHDEAPVPPPPPPPLVAADPETAASVFDAANRARVSGREAEAERLYREVSTRFGAAPEGRLSHALLGRLLLDSGDARGALLELDAYLRSGEEALQEEALAAKAQALGRIGASGEERAAWEAVLSAYPEGVHSARARQRLSELGGR